MMHDLSEALRSTQIGPEAHGDLSVAGSVTSPEAQHVRDVIAGKVQPQALPLPDAVKELLQRLTPGREPPRWLRENVTLRAHYAGRAVLCFQPTPAAEIAVLAVGETAIGEVLQYLSADEVARIVIRYPHPLTNGVSSEAQWVFDGRPEDDFIFGSATFHDVRSAAPL